MTTMQLPETFYPSRVPRLARTLMAAMMTQAFLAHGLRAMEVPSYEITWSAITSGGHTASAGEFTVHGSSGQHSTGTMAGGDYAVTAGFWAPESGGPPACSTLADCSDADADGIRDDSCLWAECIGQSCNAVEVAFADLGGAFGDCAPDGFVNLFDRTHALTGFAGTSSCDVYNLDVGGPFGSCQPDGFCNLFDANHALTAFAGINTCTCPAVPAPQGTLEPAGATALALQADAKRIRPGATVGVRVFASDALENLQSYQLHVRAGGGRRGTLELSEVIVEERRDLALGEQGADYNAFNVATGQMLAGLEAGGVVTPAAAYLATFVYQASDDAEGPFVVDLLHDESAGDQTYLVADFVQPVAITEVAPAVIFVEPPDDAPLSSRK